MRTLENIQLTPNFRLYEFIEGINLPYEAIQLNWQNIDDFSLQKCRMIAELMQEKRAYINRVFRTKNKGKEIKIIVLSGFRCLAWERIRNRDGNSQHVQSWAADIQPDNCSDELAVEIIAHLRDKEWDIRLGHKGGFAIKEPAYKNGQIETIGFAHYDMRPNPARWNY
jgi:hypothetical protein